MKRKFLCLVAALALMLTTGLYTPVLALPAATDQVTIYTTNDIHGVVEENADSATIGMAWAAALKASTPNALLVDAGDATQGASFASVSLGEDVIKMMNAADYDVMAAGNHEFDYGKEQLLKNVRAADFPVLSANVTADGSPLLQENTTITVGDHTIGFIGLTTTRTATSTNPAKLQGVEFNDEIDTAKAQIDALAGDVDAIVLVCHLGDNDTATAVTSDQLLDGLDDEQRKKVAAVIDGHSHTVEDADNTYVHGAIRIPIIQTGTLSKNLGKIVITFDGDSVSASGSVMDYDAVTKSSLTEDGAAAKAKVEQALAEIKKAQAPLLSRVICTNEVPLWGGYIYYDYVESRIVETAYGDFVADAFAYYAKAFADKEGADIPVIAAENGGGIGQTLPSGKVTRGDVLDAFNHGNMVEVMDITPKQLYEALEKGLTMTGQDDTGLLVREKVSGSFLQVSGFSYTYDPAGVAGSKVTDVTLADGTKLSRDDSSRYLLLATNNYVASGLTLDEGAKRGELGGEDTLIEDYLSLVTDGGTKPLSIKTTAGRIKIANDRSPATHTVTIPVTDSDGTAAPAGRIVHVSVDGGQEQEFVTDENGNITLTLSKGGHTLYMKESMDAQPFVYVNNYSGSGTVTTRDGYYKLGFTVDADKLAVAEENPDAPQDTEVSNPASKPQDTEKSKPEAKPQTAVSAPDTDTTPQTGDDSDMGLWLALATGAAAAAIGTLITGRRRSRRG